VFITRNIEKTTIERATLKKSQVSVDICQSALILLGI